MADRVMTAPLAIIKVGGVAIGKMRNIRVRESIQRGRVQGLGQLQKDELPAIAWEGTLSCSFFLIDFSKSQIPGGLLRRAQSIEQWARTVLLQEEGVSVDILRRVATSPIRNGTVPIESQLEVFASVRNAFLNSDSFNIDEGNIGGRDQEFEYLEPILFPA